MFAYYEKNVNIEDVIEREYSVSGIADLLEEMFLSGSKNKSFNSIIKTAMLSHISSGVFIEGIKAVSNTVGVVYDSDKIFTHDFRTELATACSEKLTIVQNPDDLEVCIFDGSVYYLGEEMFSISRQDCPVNEINIEIDPISSDCWFLKEVRKHNS